MKYTGETECQYEEQEYPKKLVVIWEFPRNARELVTLVLLYMEQYINLWVSTTLDH
jgi:hypothetical protein